MFVSLINYCSSSSLFHCSFVVCKDGSCSGDDNDYACLGATIGSVVGPSCQDEFSCYRAQIGSVDSSCKASSSCIYAQLSDVDLINSCNKEDACAFTNGNEAFDDLIDCCNDEVEQCKDDVGADIVAAGCVSYCLLYCF